MVAAQIGASTLGTVANLSAAGAMMRATSFLLFVGSAFALVLSACESKQSDKTQQAQQPDKPKERTRGDVCALLGEPYAKAQSLCGEKRGMGRHEDLYLQARKIWFDNCCVGAECQQPPRPSPQEIDTCMKALADPMSRIDEWCRDPYITPEPCRDIMGEGEASRRGR